MKQNIISRSLIYLVNKLWLTLATLVILTAVGFVLLRMLLPQINYFKDDIENWVEQKYQVEVSVEEIDAGWGASGPVLSARNVQIKSDDGQLSLFSVESFSIQLDGFSSLFSQSLITESIEIAGASVSFIIDRNLGVRFDALENTKQKQANLEVQKASRILLNSLFDQKYLSINQSTINLETMSGKSFRYTADQLSIRNYGNIHQVTGKLFDESSGQIKLVAEIHGDPSLDTSQTHIYLEGSNIEISTLPILERQSHLKPQRGHLNWRLWSDWRNARWQSAVGDIELTNVEWLTEGENSTQSSTPIAGIEHFFGELNWSFEDADNGIFRLHNVELKQKQKMTASLPDLYFLFNQNEAFDLKWDLVTHNLQLAPFAEYLDVIFKSEGATQGLFKKSGLGLELGSLGIRLFKKNGVWYLPKIVTEFSDLVYDNLMGLPRLNGVSGALSYANGTGSVDLEGTKVELDFGDLFRNTISAESFNVSLTWRNNADSPLDLIINAAHFSNKDLTLNAKSHFYFIGDKPALSLYAELTDIDISNKSLYLPTGIMSESLIDYLDNSVKSGGVPFAKAALRGPLDAFPFDNEEGLFSILGNVKNATFQYQPEWPIAKSIDAKLLFEGAGMDLLGLSGNSANNRLNRARAVIKDYSLDNTPFELYLDVTSVDNSGKSFLLNSPLESIGHSLEYIDYKGNIQTDLALFFGLNDASDLRMKGAATPDTKKSQVKVAGMTLTDIDGSVSFDQNGVQKSRLSAHYHGSPLTADIVGANSTKKEKQAELLINVKGKLEASALQDFVGESWADFAHGSTTFNTIVQVAPPHARDLTLVHMTSDLYGIDISLPDEFYKPVQTKTPLVVAVEIGEVLTASIEWQAFKGKWQWQSTAGKSKTIGGIFQYNIDKPLPKNVPSQILVEGKLGTVNFDAWYQVYQHVDKGIYEPSKNELPAIDINLEIKEIINSAVELSNVEFAAHNSQGQNWVIGYNNVLGNGILKVFKDNPWELEIKNLLFDFKPGFLERKDEPEKNIANFGDNPLAWPEVDIQCHDCRILQRQFGDISANLRSHETGLTLSGMVDDDKRHNLVFKLNWIQKDTNTQVTAGNVASNTSAHDFTYLEYDLRSDNVGKLMQRWQYPVGIEESSGHLVGNLYWSDKPWAFEPLEIEGDARFRFGEGFLSEISDAKARLFSLFNLQSLRRRLQLDFADVYKKGFFYKEIEGDVSMRDGVVSTANTYIDGNAAKVELAGSVDFKNESIEQTALITPQLTSSLPILVGWAVEPTTGLLVYLLNKIMEPAIDVVTQIEYQIHGTLDDIKVDQISKLKSKIKIEQIIDSNGDSDSDGSEQGNMDENEKESAKDDVKSKVKEGSKTEEDKKDAAK